MLSHCNSSTHTQAHTCIWACSVTIHSHFYSLLCVVLNKSSHFCRILISIIITTCMKTPALNFCLPLLLELLISHLSTKVLFLSPFSKLVLFSAGYSGEVCKWAWSLWCGSWLMGRWKAFLYLGVSFKHVILKNNNNKLSMDWIWSFWSKNRTVKTSTAWNSAPVVSLYLFLYIFLSLENQKQVKSIWQINMYFIFKDYCFCTQTSLAW